MAQNIYDDEDFFSGYSTLPRSVHGHDGAPEWPSLRSMLPGMPDRRVLDLGCGFGWFSRWAADNGAAGVVGTDLSERMLAKARAETDTSIIDYQLQNLASMGQRSSPATISTGSLTSPVTSSNFRDLASNIFD